MIHHFKSKNNTKTNAIVNKHRNSNLTFLYVFVLLFSILHINNSYSIELEKTDKTEKSENIDNLYYNNQFYVRFKAGSKFLNEFDFNGNDNTKLGVAPKPNKHFQILRPLMPIEARLINNPKRLEMLKSKKGFNQTQISKIYKLEEVLSRTFVAKNLTKTEMATFCHKLRLYSSEIEDAEPIYNYKLQSKYTPNDQFVLQQEVLNVIKAFDAWGISFGKTEITIAIADNGVMQTHPDYEPNIALNLEDPVNGVDDDGNGYIDDYNGFNFYSRETNSAYNQTSVSDNHGTIVAGIAAAKSDNSLGMAGVGGLCTTFPLRCSGLNSDNVSYGYEAILYAGVRAFDVINCSWGNEKKGFSSIEQSIVDFADANGVFVINSGGNRDFSDIDEERLATFYPSAYKNVFSVGEVDIFDYVTESSSLGSHLDLMAPGYDNFSLNTNGSYTRAGFGTSFAAPVVAGSVGIMKSHYPNLSNRQIAHILRQSGDDITALNQDMAPYLPNRLNLLNALTIDPFSIPGLEFEEIIFRDNKGNRKERVMGYDTVDMSFKIKNYLGDAKNLKFKIYPIYYNNEFALQFEKSEIEIASIKADEEIELNGFRFILNDFSDTKMVLRIDIEGENNYFDWYVFDFMPNSPIATFENNKLKFSITDDGLLGFTNPAYNKNGRHGSGFTIKGLSDGLYSGGLITTINDNLVSTAYNTGNSDFAALKQFRNPDTNAIITNKQTLTINKCVLINRLEDKFVRFDLEVQNTAFEDLNKVAVGYYVDWDLGVDVAPFNNNISYLSDVLPSEYNGIGGVQYITNADNTIHFGALVASKVSSAELQIAKIDGASRSNFRRALNSGTLWQTEEKNSDVQGVFGILFNEILPADAKKNCSVCLAGGSTKEELVLNLQNCILNKTLSVELGEEFDPNTLIIYPNPTINEFAILGINQVAQNIKTIEVLDLFGNVLKSYTLEDIINNQFDFNEDELLSQSNTNTKISNGQYFVKITTLKDNVIIKNLIKN